MYDLTENYLKLQNGSDIRGIALEGVPGENVNLTPEIARNITSAFITYLSKKENKSAESLEIAVGHDSRISASLLKAGVLEGIQNMGSTAYDCSLASTPSMFMSTVLEGLEFDGGIMITASHLPYNRNGMKFFTKDGCLESKEIREVLEIAIEIAKKEPGKAEHIKEVQKLDLLSYYSDYLKKVIKKEVGSEDEDKPLKGLHIVVDASNGSGGFFVKKVLEPLGADTTGSACLEPDGTFPVHEPNPENRQAMEYIKKITLEHHADLGIIFDTDVDRMGAVFSNGKEINKNAIVALMSAIVASQHPNTTIVTDSVTSEQLTDFLENKLNLKHHRFKRGYKNVINEAIRLNQEGIETHLAIETSGHGALKENYFLDDGAYMAVKIICELVKCKRQGKALEDLLEGLKEPEDSIEIRIPIKVDNFKEYGQEVLEEFKKFAGENDKFNLVKNNYEGVRITFNDDEVSGWMLLRMSLHDPILPMNIETDNKGGVAIALKRLAPFFKKFDGLDISVLSK
jgi:phosphomannomutase